MPGWVGAGSHQIEVAAAKAALMYLTALLGLRVAHRRTVAQWKAIDFAAAVAVGAIVGRTALASNQSLVIGVVALVAILAAHTVVTLGRFSPLVAKLTDHRVRVLVAHGEVRRRQLRICGLTENDLFAHLRQQGVYDVAALRYVLYEARGGLTVVRDSDGSADLPLVDRGLENAVRR